MAHATIGLYRIITADTAIRLGLYFNTSAQMWLNLQSRYDLMVVERSSLKQIKTRIRTLKVA